MQAIDLALSALESLSVGEKPNYTAVAKIYGVNRLILSRRYRGV